MEKLPGALKSPLSTTSKRNATSTSTIASGGTAKVFARPAAFVRPTSQNGLTITANSSPSIKSPLNALPNNRSFAKKTSSIKSSRPNEVAIRVAVRVRQTLIHELDSPSNSTSSITVDRRLGTISLGNGDQERVFKFDHCIRDLADDGQTADDRQKYVFDRLGAPMVSDAINGVNSTLFAYGQTGSGKTYSLFGTSNEPGLIPRTCDLLLSELQRMDKEVRWSVEVSFLEMYNEKLRDLLIPEENAPQLKIRDFPGEGVFVQGLSTVPVERFEDVQTLIEIGCGRRITACTVNNNHSSRSHVLFMVKVKTQKKVAVDNQTFYFRTVKSKLNMVDLAGSERLSALSRLRETTSINKSLSCLAMVIDQLSEKARFINHRDSALTWLLKESLGGNAKTTILATVSPAQRSLKETYRTLRYADRAKRMTNRVRVNEDKSSKIVADLVDELESRNRLLTENREEIQRLRLQLSMANSTGLKEANRTSVAEVQLQYDNEAKKSGKNISSSFIQTPSGPFIVLLSPDPQVSEGLLFSLSAGRNRIGTDRSCDVVVRGTRIASLHCTLSLTEENRATIIPTKSNDTFINGILTEDARELFSGDRLCLAGEQYFILYLERPEICDMEGLFDKAQVEYLRAQNKLLLNELESIRTVKQEGTDNVETEKRIPKRSAGVEEKRIEKMISTPRRRSANTQTPHRKAVVSISTEDMDACESIVAVDFMVLEANSIMESSNDPFRFALCDKVEVKEGEPLCLTVKMTNTSMNIFVTMPATDFQDHWAVLLSLHQRGKRERFSSHLKSMFFSPSKEEESSSRRVSDMFPLAMAVLKESRRTSMASFDRKVAEIPKLSVTPSELKALSGQTSFFSEGFASINNIQCNAPKVPVDWFLLSAGSLELLLERFRSNTNEYLFPVIFGLQHMHVCELVYAEYPSRLPGVGASRELFQTAMKRLWNAMLSILMVANDGGPLRAETQEMLSVLLGEVVETAASLSFVMPSVAGSHCLTEPCNSCKLSPKLLEALLRGAYYGYKRLKMIIESLVDQAFSDRSVSKAQLEAVVFGLELLKPIAKSCKSAAGDLRATSFVAFNVLRPLMHSLCAVAGFKDVSFKTEEVQNVKNFLDALKECPGNIDAGALRKALASIYPHLPDLRSFENNVLLSSQQNERGR